MVPTVLWRSKKSMTKTLKSYLFAILLVLLLTVVGLFGNWLAFVFTPQQQAPNSLIIPAGQPAKVVVLPLTNGTTWQRYRWYITMVLLDATHRLNAGEYQVRGMTPWQLVRHWRRGEVLIHEFTIIPGETVQQIRAALLSLPNIQHQLPSLTPQQLLKALGWQPLLTKWHQKTTSLEGLLFPDTYQYLYGDSDVSILQKSAMRMQQKLLQTWAERKLPNRLRNPYAALTLASLIEKETALDRERALIAGVLTNRLHKVMHLGVDPSVVYGLHQPFGTPLTRKDLRQKTPYNTYLNYGLPPTPICAPSLASMMAAVKPDATDDYYYVAKGDGSHQFSVTLAEQRAAIKKYLLSK